MGLVRRFLTGSFALLGAAAIGSLANYAYTIAMGRLLGPADFGALQALFALFALATTPAVAFQTIVAELVARLAARGKRAKIAGLLRQALRFFLALGLGVAVFFIIFRSPLADLFRLGLPTLVIALSLIFLSNFPLIALRGMLQGLQRFTSLAWNLTAEPIGKFGLGLAAVLAGFGLFGALGGFILADVAVFVLALWQLRSLARMEGERVGRAEIGSYPLLVFASFALGSLFLQADLLIIKASVPPELAGRYAALAVAGKIPFFLAAPIFGVAFPQVVERASRGERSWPVVALSLSAGLAIALAVLAGFTLFPTFSMRLLFGPQYLELSPLLPLYALAMVFYTLAAVFGNFFVAARESRFLGPAALITASAIGSFLLVRTDPAALVSRLATSSGLLALSYTLLYLLPRRNQIGEITRELLATLSHRTRLQRRADD